MRNGTSEAGVDNVTSATRKFTEITEYLIIIIYIKLDNHNKFTPQSVDSHAESEEITEVFAKRYKTCTSWSQRNIRNMITGTLSIINYN